MDFQQQCFNLEFTNNQDIITFIKKLYNFCYGFKTQRIVTTIDDLQKKYDFFNINELPFDILEHYILQTLKNGKINLIIDGEKLYPIIFRNIQCKTIINYLTQIPHQYSQSVKELARFYFVNKKIQLDFAEMEILLPFVDKKEYVISVVFSPNRTNDNQFAKMDFFIQNHLELCKKCSQPILDEAILNDNKIDSYDTYLEKIQKIVTKKQVHKTVRKIKNWEFAKFLNGVSKIKFLLQFYHPSDPVQLQSHPSLLSMISKNDLYYLYYDIIPHIWNEIDKNKFIKLILHKNCKKEFAQIGYNKFNCYDIFLDNLKFRNVMMQHDINIPIVQFLLHT